jgi:hypothetical protein
MANSALMIFFFSPAILVIAIWMIAIKATADADQITKVVRALTHTDKPADTLSSTQQGG